MVTSLCMAIAPAFITSMFAFSIKSQILQGNLVWVVMFVVAATGFVHSLTLSEPEKSWQES